MIPDVSLAPSCAVFGRAYVDCSDAVVVGVGVAASAEEDVIHFFVNSRTAGPNRNINLSPAMTAIPNAACYFCLEEGPDDEGKSLVRDCSCRGDSAGFAHLSCLTKYAEQKCRAANYTDLDAFVEPWNKCNNCKQTFQNQLRWIYHLHLYPLPRQPTAILATASGIN